MRCRAAMMRAVIMVAVAATASAVSAEPQPVSEREVVEADVSTRSVAVTSTFAGVEIIVFGTVHNSRQTSASVGLYDVVVIVEGMSTPLIARRKSRVAGIWVNTQSMRVDRLPSYYAIASTRPIAEIADNATLDRLEIGFQSVGVKPRGRQSQFTASEIEEYRHAIVRLKQRDNLFVSAEYGVSFIGRSLFRTSIVLPPNVPVGPLRAKVFLFKDGAVLSQYSAQLRLELEGVEQVLHTFAFQHPIFYGMFAVLLGASAGLLASVLFRRRG